MKELCEMELREVEGGVGWLAILAIAADVAGVILAIAYVVDNWDSVEKGAKEGWAAAGN